MGTKGGGLMQLNDYQVLAERTANTTDNIIFSFHKRLLNFSLGITGEAGEFANLVKKIIFHGHDYDKGKLKEELGDQLWYVATLATTIGCTLEEVAQYNIDKLKRRYPNGFNANDSIKRVDVNGEEGSINREG
jgi:NTP pyrophosphatase (non-canonical NTP hydrolase)